MQNVFIGKVSNVEIHRRCIAVNKEGNKSLAWKKNRAGMAESMFHKLE